MRFRPLIVLLLAIVLGSGSVYMARQYTAAQPQKAVSDPAASLTTVVVARVPLSFGHRLTSESLKEVRWPRHALPDESFATIDEVIGDGSEPRYVLRGIEPNEPVLKAKISGFGGRATLSAVIPNDHRGVTIRVNDVLGVAGFVLPGDRVDVMLTRDTENDKPITDVLLQGVKVLGVDQQASENSDTPAVARAVTLEVTPRQAQKLTLGQQVGTLSLSLRNQLDLAAEDQKTVTLADLNVGETAGEITQTAEAPQPRRQAPTGFTVRVGRGLNWSSQKVGRE